MKTVVFCRSKESNGVLVVIETLSKIDYFIAANTVKNLIQTLKKEKSVSSILCLSSTDAVICNAVLSFYNLKIPIVMCTYHPKQWGVMLDIKYSKKLSMVFQKFLSKTDISNHIFNSEEAYLSSMSYFNLNGHPNLITAPSFPPEINNCSFKLKKDSDNTFCFCTVGRLVDFKLKTVYSLIDTIERLNLEDDFNVEYHIFGNGPLEQDLISKISNSQCKEKIIFHGYLENKSFGGVISQFDCYFGMGFTVVHSSMLGIPSIIAIQDESRPISYGFFNSYDHKINPMFGDKSKFGIETDLYDTVKKFILMNKSEKEKLGNECKIASAPYDMNTVIEKMRNVCLDAKYIDCRISIYEIFIIRIQQIISRFLKRAQSHT